MIEVGAPLEEALGGNAISVQGSSGAAFSANVLKACGFDVAEHSGPSSAPALTSGIAGLVLKPQSLG